LGTLYRNLGDMDRALEYTQKTVDLNQGYFSKKEEKEILGNRLY